MIQLCRHILPSGVLCEQAAVKETIYCRHHGTLKRAVAACRPAPDPYGFHKSLPFVFPEDRAAVQLNYFLVLQALNHKTIDNRTANTMNRLLRSCEMNLKRGRLVDGGEEAARRVVLTPEGEEIAPPRERLEEGEERAAHGAECPCRRCAEEFRGAAPEEHHVDCGCGACGDSAAGGASRTGAVKAAPARTLYDREPAKVGVDKDDADLPAYLKIGSEYEQRYADIVAGLIEPEPPEPLDPNGPMAEAIRSYERSLLEIEENKRIGAEIYRRRFPEAAAAEEAEERRRAGLA